MCLDTRLAALSSSTPVGSPDSSRTITPSGGSGVSRVMPAICKARVFTSAPCLLTMIDINGAVGADGV